MAASPNTPNVNQTGSQYYASHSTRVALLGQLSGTPTARLAELVRIAGFIFVPDEDQLINVTMADMVQKAHGLADIYFPQWTDRSKSDFGEFLVELFGLFSEKDFYYINAFTNEGFLQKATIYSNLIYKALSNGYLPNLAQSAIGKIRLEFSSGSDLMILPGQIVCAIPNTSLRYSNVETILVPATAGSYYITTDFAHGVYRTDNINFNGRSIRITTKKVDIHSISHIVNGEQWERVADFANSNSTDKHFIILPEEEGTFQIIYGFGQYGSRPTIGTPTITVYRVGCGSDANQGNIIITQLSISPSARPVTTITQVSVFAGGQDPETTEDIRNHGSLAYRTQQSIKGVRDMVTVLEQFPDILKAQAIIFANNLWFYVIPTGLPADATFLENVRLRIKDQVVDIYQPGGVPTVYIPVVCDIDVYLLQGFDTASVIQQVTDYFIDYTNPFADAKYGQDFNMAEFTEGCIANIPGVQNIQFNSVNGASPANVTVLDSQVMKAAQVTDITITIVPVA